MHTSVHVLLFSPLLRPGAVRCPTSRLLAPPILLLTCYPSLSMHHSVLLLSSSDTGRSLCCHCASSLCVLYLSLRLTPLMFPSPLRPSPRVSSLCLCMSAHRLTFFLSCPVLTLFLSPLPPYLPHEDSAPAEVDELSQPQRSGEE